MPVRPLAMPVREGDVLDRETINVESFVVESWFVHHDPFEYEYEYRAAP